MSIQTIRDRLAAILDGVVGINSANAYPPDVVGALPAAWCGLNDETIAYTAGMKIVDHTLQIVVINQRTAGRLGQGLDALETLQARIEAALEADMGLGGAVSIAMLSRVQQETIQIGDVPYLGFVATLRITEKTGVSLS